MAMRQWNKSGEKVKLTGCIIKKLWNDEGACNNKEREADSARKKSERKGRKRRRKRDETRAREKRKVRERAKIDERITSEYE